MGKKRRKEFSDTAVIVLLVAVILVSFIGTLLLYKNISNASLNAIPPGSSINQQNSKLVGATGLVTITVADRNYENPDGGNKS